MSRPRRHRVRRGALIVRALPVMEQCIAAGVALGWQRAHKHHDRPTEQEIRDAQVVAVLDLICESFAVDDEP